MNHSRTSSLCDGASCYLLLILFLFDEISKLAMQLKRVLNFYFLTNDCMSFV